MQEFMYRDTTNVEYEMYDYAGNNCRHQNSNERFKKNSEAMPGKHLTYSLQKTAILGTSYPWYGRYTLCYKDSSETHKKKIDVLKH